MKYFSLLVIILFWLSGCGTETPDNFFGGPMIPDIKPEVPAEPDPGDPIPDDPNCVWKDEIILVWEQPGPVDENLDIVYKLYVGEETRDYNQSFEVGTVMTHMIMNAVPGVPYYFAVTGRYATGEDLRESDYSNYLSTDVLQ